MLPTKQPSQVYQVSIGLLSPHHRTFTGVHLLVQVFKLVRLLLGRSMYLEESSWLSPIENVKARSNYHDGALEI